MQKYVDYLGKILADLDVKIKTNLVSYVVIVVPWLTSLKIL